MDEYLSTKQIAKLLGVSSITIRRWIQKGELPAIYLGNDSREYRVAKKDFMQFLELRKVKINK